MTPEEKIVEAIDRNTAAVKKSGAENQLMLLSIIIILLPMACCPRAKGATLTPPLEQPALWDIGDPPAPPPNPNVQYWYTMDVPTDDGVLPVEVFAPKLVAQKAVVTCTDCTIRDNRGWTFKDDPVDVPEPGMLAGFAIAAVLFSVCYIPIVLYWRTAAKTLRSKVYVLEDRIREYRSKLRLIQFAISDDGKLREIARKALEE